MRVSDEAELVAAISASQAPVEIRGGGTRPVGRLDLAATVLDTGGLSGIARYEPDALTLVAGAGTSLSEIEAVLAQAGQRLAFEPADWRGLLGTSGASTIGGVVAANVSGPRRVQTGACRDALLGVRFVDGTGAVLRNGGRVMKNVTGYDLVRLLAGAWGTLGVLSEVALKVEPQPEAEVTLALPSLSPALAVPALAAALGSPYAVTGAAWLPGAGALVRIEGFSRTLAARMDRLAAILARFGAVERRTDGPSLWAEVAQVTPFHDRKGAVWRFSVKASQAGVLAERLGGEVVLDWGGGLVWALVPEDVDARALARPYQGHATLMRGAGFPVFEPEPPVVAALSQRLRARFDPRGILNPGRMG